MRAYFLFAGFFPITLLISATASAGFTLYEQGAAEFVLSGDARLRFEQDWNSKKTDGTSRDDRARIRYRARARLDAKLNERWKGVLRVRSGDDDSQQSPHVTIYDFNDDPKGPTDFNADLWYGQFRTSGWDIWGGRNRINIWQQDELTIDDDVTIKGFGVSYTHALGEASLSWKAGYGDLPAGMQDYSGEVSTAQLVYARDAADGYGFTLAGGYLGVNADPDDPHGQLLLTENGGRDYETGFIQAQIRTQAMGRPLKLGADAGHNFEDYDAEPQGSFSEYHKDDVDYYVLFVNWGKSAEPGDWLLGYYYSHVEALALSSSYTQDDWLRWGNRSQTRATNFKGSEFRAVYRPLNNLNVVARVYQVDAIRKLNEGDAAKEDGNRARIDFNFSF